MPNQKCYALILLGTSPGIVTELLWWLLQVDHREILGAKVWTTGTDDRSFTGKTGYQVFDRALFQEGGWETLRQSLGQSAEKLPSPIGWPCWPAELSDTPEEGRLKVVLFGARTGQLTDIRTPKDAECVAAQLHDRVRVLRQSLPADVELVGSLAGGRKTMSASLYGAFSLQARPSDRLLHMLLHPEVEARSQGGRHYFAPTPEMTEQTGLPPAQQMSAYEVGVPLVGALASGRALRQVLDTHPYQGIWPALRANSRAEGTHTATLRPEDPDRTDRWRLEVCLPGDDAPVYTVGLNGSQAETYHAIASHPEGATDSEWWAWLIGQPRLKWSQGDTWERDGADIAKVRRSDLGRQLSGLTLEGLSSFCVQSNGGRPARHHVPACERVSFEYPDTAFHTGASP